MAGIIFYVTVSDPAGGHLKCPCGTTTTLRANGKLAPGPIEVELVCSCGAKGSMVIGGDEAAFVHTGMGGGISNVGVDRDYDHDEKDEK